MFVIEQTNSIDSGTEEVHIFDMTLVHRFITVVLCLCVVLPKPRRDLLCKSCFNNFCKDTINDSNRCLSGWRGLNESLNPSLFKQTCEVDGIHNATTCFAPYFEIFPIPSSINPTLLWSVIMETAVNLSEKAATWGINLTSSSTLEAAKIIDKMEDKGTPDCINFWGVPGYSNTPRFFFWRELSRALASNSDGIVFYLTPGAYNETNFFGLYELPALLNKNSKAKKLVVLNILTGKRPKSCEDTPLINLKQKVISERRSLNYSCHDVNDTNTKFNDHVHNDELIERLMQTIKILIDSP